MRVGKRMLDKNFWLGRKVFITGNTGFKGAWLSLLLKQLGAELWGYSLAPSTEPNLFHLLQLEKSFPTTIGDIRNLDKVITSLKESKAEIVMHMAAQPLVKESYRSPVETFETNVMGTVNLFEAVRNSNTVKAVVNITTDKCYENKEWIWGYRETDRLGGFDPYSSSKACSEMITSSYRNSFFASESYQSHGIAIASARAGNVIGGGDWSEDRLIPDCFRAIFAGKPINLRYPYAIRPWQHVLSPLVGYLLLAEKLYKEGPSFGQAWNFGPEDRDNKTVLWIVEQLCNKWGKNCRFYIEDRVEFHESRFLRLDSSKAKQELGWFPKWDLEVAIEKIIEWYECYQKGQSCLSILCEKQISQFLFE